MPAAWPTVDNENGSRDREKLAGHMQPLYFLTVDKALLVKTVFL